MNLVSRLFCRLAFLICTGVGAGGLAAAEAPPLTIAVSTAEVRVTNATPGEKIVLYSAAIESYGGYLRQYSTIKEITADKKDGAITYTSDGPIALRSVWVAVDEYTGRLAISGRAGYPVYVATFPVTLLKKDTDGILGLMDVEGRTAELLIVRPKQGAWLVKGSPADPQVSNGKLTLVPGDAKAVGSSESAPLRIRNGDVLVLMNTGRLEVSAVEIGK